jgi:hypothetical protein
MNIKPIETHYKGYRFRSRLEARWAVFFDALNIKWEYESEGFEHESWGVRYLPDFRFIKTKTWVEVKGDSTEVKRKHGFFTEVLDFGGILPDFEESFGTTRGLLFLGNIPEIYSYETVFHPIIQHHEGLYLRYVMFTPRAVLENVSGLYLSELLDLAGEDCIDADDGSKWSSDPKTIKLPSYDENVKDAYDKARKARFEHNKN